VIAHNEVQLMTVMNSEWHAHRNRYVTCIDQPWEAKSPTCWVYFQICAGLVHGQKWCIGGMVHQMDSVVYKGAMEVWCMKSMVYGPRWTGGVLMLMVYGA
jgi:hypothetical protein